MSPRFTGKQYPGAMKDHRARKREEAETRQAHSRLQTLRAMQQFGDTATKQPGPFQPLVDAFKSIAEMFTGVHTTTQNDYALVPAPISPNALAGINLPQGPLPMMQAYGPGESTHIDELRHRSYLLSIERGHLRRN